MCFVNYNLSRGLIDLRLIVGKSHPSCQAMCLADGVTKLRNSKKNHQPDQNFFVYFFASTTFNAQKCQKINLTLARKKQKKTDKLHNLKKKHQF